uniref:Uncharacterized protein n=1 Tax=Knipowitschia caucasica TaxID=637954 RepID=A0AAV2L8C8_KNICA
MLRQCMFSQLHTVGCSGRIMSMQTGSSRGHHLANYLCCHISTDLGCQRRHITPCPNCPPICQSGTGRDAVWKGYRGQRGGDRRVTLHQLVSAAWTPARTHSREDTPRSLNVTGLLQCPCE